MKDEDGGGGAYSPFAGIEKGAVLQECRIFNDRQLNTRRCEEVLVRLLYLVGQGDVLSSEEATVVFFSVTKLFQANEPTLRRLVYLAIKELAHSAEEVIIVTNCLTKDINSEVDMYRANATRVLCTITDAQIIQQVERYLKQEIVDRNPVVASSALVSGQQLIAHGKGESVRRWVNEITQALDHRSPMVQYHALALLYLIKQHDRLAVSKLVQNMTRQGVRSSMALVLLIRYVSRIIAEDPRAAESSSGVPRPFFDFLEACLRHRADIVSYEAARSIADLPNVSPTELTPAVSVLQRFLVQPNPALRFSAIRTLNRIAGHHPLAVSTCNADMEVLISDSNRSIATLAITTLLRTGSEGSIERLLRQIQGFLSDIADEFKVKVVDAIRALCEKYPYKYDALMSFLGDSLKDEGGFAYKKAIVEAFLDLVDKIPESKETCLAHLCEFIEDCEHSQLSTQILHLLGKEGPSMPKPGNYIRYIYNRLILENATVRAAAVAALSRFAGTKATVSMRRSVAILLRQSLMDSDDEVRDRATFFMSSLGLHKFTVDHDEVGSAIEEDHDQVEEKVNATDKLLELPCPIANLEVELLRYVNNGNMDVAFDINSVSMAAMGGVVPSSLSPLGGETVDRSGPISRRKEVVTDLAAEVMKVEQFAALGRPFRSCPAKELTEAETEYTASVVVHLYANHVILEFLCCNTLTDQQLEDVVVQVDTSACPGLGDMTLVPAPVLKFDVPERTYAAIQRTADGEYPLGVLGCSLKFAVKDVDPATGVPDEEAYHDDYTLDDLTLGTAHLMAPPAELPKSFKSAWEDLGPDNEVADSFTLDQDSVPEAVAAIVELLGMAPFENTQVVNDRASSHVLLMAGVFFPGVHCLLHAKFAVTSDCVVLDMVCRSQDPAVSELIASSIASPE